MIKRGDETWLLGQIGGSHIVIRQSQHHRHTLPQHWSEADAILSTNKSL
jgi:hypothetical protein